jgi:hypothetical protein
MEPLPLKKFPKLIFDHSEMVEMAARRLVYKSIIKNAKSYNGALHNINRGY